MENENIDKRKRIRKSSQENEEENKQIEKNHKNFLLKEKEDDKKYMEEYSKKLREDEKKRQKEKKTNLSKIKCFTSHDFYSKFLDINDLKKKDMQIKNENNLSFSEKKKLFNENEIKYTLLRERNKTKMTLKDQIEIKKQEKSKNYRLNIEDKIKLNEYLNHQDDDNKIKLLKRMLTLKEYKKFLEEQIKKKNKDEFMNEEERKINKGYLQRLC